MRIFALVILSIFISCEQNPYPDGDLRKTPRAPREVVPPALSMVLPDVLELEEGRERILSINVSVPAPGKPDVRVDHLPAGATFDPTTLKISWKPGYFDGNNPADVTIKSRIYPVDVWLRSTEDETEAIKKTVNFIVYDSPRNLDINGATSISGNEGDEFSYSFKVENLDYPNGPFSINTLGMPTNTIIEKISDTEFKLKFKVDHHHVKINEYSNCSTSYQNCINYAGKIFVFNPANHKSEKEVEVKIIDKRLGTKIVVPEQTEQGLDISFQVSGYDLNGEVAPKIEMISNEPIYGDFETEIFKDEENNASVLNVYWKDIPPIYNQSEHFFTFKSCVLDSRKSYRDCTEATTKVKIVVKERKPPTFDRSNWSAGVIHYLKHEESQTTYIPIRDGDSRKLVHKVDVMPKEMNKYVKWSGSDLKVKFDKPGIHQFTLVATSEYNMSSAESFVVEVFEETRAKTLYFTDSSRDKEVKFYRDTLKNVELMNPALQILNERNLSGRDTLIVGTGILQDLNMQNSIERAMDKIDNIVVASPLVENMPAKFLEEFKTKNKVAIIGRYSELPDTPDLKDMEFVFRRDFKTPNDIVKLMLSATVESVDPVLFSTGVDTNNCADVLEISDAKKLTRYKIGVICQRGVRGRLAVLGTEFADLKTSVNDSTIPSDWFRTMLTTKIFDRGNK